MTALPVYEDDGSGWSTSAWASGRASCRRDQLRVARPAGAPQRPGVRRPDPGGHRATFRAAGSTPSPRNSPPVYGPWTFQAEWAGQFLTDAMRRTAQTQGTVFFHGGYVQVLYFLTGEHQEYDKREGVFGRVVPRNNYHVKKCDDCVRPGRGRSGAASATST